MRIRTRVCQHDEVAMEKNSKSDLVFECRRDHAKLSVSTSCPRSGGQLAAIAEVTCERQKLDEDVASLIKRLQETEAKLMRVNQEYEIHQSAMKAIRQEKDDTIKQRKKVDEHLQSLNNEITDKREVLVRLQGNLQYRKEEKINEAIRRLEYQLVANNYKVTEEIKIVQEIDRLKRSKKSLCQYLALKEELDRTKDKLNTMRNERDALYRRVASFKSGEEEVKNNIRENRTSSDELRKEIDELYTKKRKAIVDLKAASQPLLHLKELHQPPHRRTVNFAKKTPQTDDNTQPVAVTPTAVNHGNEPSSTCRIMIHEASHHVPPVFRKRFPNKRSPTMVDPHADHVRLCGTLITYLLRMTNVSVTPATTPAAVTPVVEHPPPSEDYVDGDWITVLHRRDLTSDMRGFHVQKGRGLKKNKKEKKGHCNKALSHTPEVLLQFDALGLKPPSIVGDIQACLDNLAAKKESLAAETVRTPHEGDIATDVDTASHCDHQEATTVCSADIVSDSPKNNCESGGNVNVTDATTPDLVSSKVDKISLVTMVLTNHADDSSTTTTTTIICDKPMLTPDELSEQKNGDFSSCCPTSLPEVIVSCCGAEGRISSIKPEFETEQCSSVDLDSSKIVSFALNATGVCNGTVTNGGSELTALESVYCCGNPVIS